MSLFEIGNLLYINVCRVFSWLELDMKANTFHVVQYTYEYVTSLLACSEEVCTAVKLSNYTLLREEITPTDRRFCRGPSLSLSPCHLVFSGACPMFSLRFLFPFIPFFLCRLFINFSYLELFLFCALLSLLYVI
jgi:hypothetical protein